MSVGEDNLDQTLAAVDAGEPGAADRLFPQVYEELRDRARRLMEDERADHTLTPTALVHDAYVKLVGRTSGWESRAHFLNAAAQAMRHVLVDHARKKGRGKNGAGWRRIETADVVLLSPGFDWVGLDAALEQFSRVDERAHKVVMLRFFGGCREQEIASVLGISPRQVRREWKTASLWLRRAMAEEKTHV